jgi:DNA-binding XRE family transcriptional regulator
MLCYATFNGYAVALTLSHGRAAMDTYETVDGRQITAARALAELTVAELAVAAGLTTRTVNRLEVGGIAHISPKKRHGHVSRAVLDKIVAALEAAGVELLPQGATFGAGVRWTTPRERR